MVSSSVAGLPAGNVTVVDQAGRLLTQSDGTGRDLNASQLKYASEVESGYQRRIETILAPVVGSANVRAQVTAQIDFASREQTDEQYQPNQQPDKAAIRSQQTSSNEQIGGPQVGGVPGALSNQPSAPATAPIETAKPAANNASNATNTRSAAANSGPLSTRRDATTNYELDRTIRHTQQKAGTVERLSVAVVVNYCLNADGKAQPMSKEQLAQIEALVREAMGYSSSRGDSLQVVNTPFTDNQMTGGELPFWQSQAFIDLLLELGRYLLVLLVGWVLWRKLIKPQLQQRQAAQQAAVAAASAPVAKANDSHKPSNEELALRRKSQQRVSAEVQSQRIRELADKDPRVVALVIRQWMSNEL